MSLVTSYLLDLTSLITSPGAWWSSEFSTYVICSLTEPRYYQSGHRHDVGHSVKDLTKSRHATFTALPLSSASHLVVEGRQVSWSQFTLHKVFLTVPSHLLGFYVSGNGFQKYLLCNVPRD